MQNIKFFAISGLDERARHCYVLEINNDIYVINFGVENPILKTFGVSKIIPDITYLVNNKERIQGLIIGTPTMANIGAIDVFFTKLGFQIPIITNEVAKTVIDTYLSTLFRGNDIRKDIEYIIANPMRDLTLKNGQVIVGFRIANSMPGSLGFVFKSPDGCVVYLDNYILASDQTKAFYSQLANIRDITKGIPVILMITQTGIVDKSLGFTAPQHNNKDFYNNIISNTSGRVIVAIHDHDAYSVFSLAQAAKRYQKNFIIYSRSFINTYQATVKAGLYNPKGLISIPLSELNNSPNAIIVITGEPEKLFDKIHKILDDEDEMVKFKPDDTFVLGTKLIAGYEGLASKLLDRISIEDIKTVVSPKTILPLEPSNEDHKFTASLIQPRYIIPVGGLYKSFVQYQNVINETWLRKEQVIILENGEVVEFSNGELVQEKRQSVPCEIVQMTAYGNTDVSESVLYEKNQMVENGAICINVMVNENGEILSPIDIFDYGIFNHNDPVAMKIFEEIKETINKNIYNYFVYKDEKTIDFKETKISLKKAITKLFDKAMNKRPIVLPTIIDISNNNDNNEDDSRA